MRWHNQPLQLPSLHQNNEAHPMYSKIRTCLTTLVAMTSLFHPVRHVMHSQCPLILGSKEYGTINSTDIHSNENRRPVMTQRAKSQLFNHYFLNQCIFRREHTKRVKILNMFIKPDTWYLNIQQSYIHKVMHARFLSRC